MFPALGFLRVPPLQWILSTFPFWGFAPSVNSVHLPAESGGSGFARLLERRLVVSGLCESPCGKGANYSRARFPCSGQEGRNEHKRHKEQSCQLLIVTELLETGGRT